MQQFHHLLQHTLDNGIRKDNRTGVATLATVGEMVKYDLSGWKVPALTTKKLAIEAVKGELLGFFRAYTSAADFRALKCRVWDQNANETESWLNNPNRHGTDHLGDVYGVIWTKWRDTRYAVNQQEADSLQAKGYSLMAHDIERNVWVYERGINQVENMLRTLITDPFSRRNIITGWRPDQIDQMCLPACHVTYCMAVDGNKKLHSTLWMRSNDLFLGHSFNALSLGILTHLMARLSGLEAASATIFITDAHVYETHVEQTKELLTREHFEAPTIHFSERIKPVSDLAEIEGLFERIEMDDIWLEGYKSHPALKAPMAA